MDIIEKLEETKAIEGVTIEICGKWIWVSGNTYAVKDRLKELGYKFSSKKGQWYWHDGQYRKLGRRELSMDEIREMFGSEAI